MKLPAYITILLLVLSCHNSSNTNPIQPMQNQDSIMGEIELYDNIAASIIDSNADIEVIGRGYNWSEGPVWLSANKMLLFSDVPENKIYQWREGDTPHVYLTPSGYTGNTPKKGEI